MKYKSFEELHREMLEAARDTFKKGFSICKGKVIDLFLKPILARSFLLAGLLAMGLFLDGDEEEEEEEKGESTQPTQKVACKHGSGPTCNLMLLWLFRLNP